MWATGGAICGIKSIDRLFYTNDTCGGQSGSPIYTWIKGHMTAVGIHTHGSNHAQYKSGCRIRYNMMEKITNNVGIADCQNFSRPQ